MMPPDLARGVQVAVAADPSRKPALARLLAQVRAGVESGDPRAAEAGIAALRQTLDAAPPLPGEERTAQGRAAGAGRQAASAPATPAEGPRPMQADATLADLARAWDAGQAKAAPGGLARQGGPKAPAPPASKRATVPAPPGGGESLLSGQGDRTAGLAWPGLPGEDGGLGGAGLATPVFQGRGNRPVPPAGRAPALQAPGQAPAPLGRGGSVPSAGRAPPPQTSGPLPPGLAAEVQGPSPLPGGQTVTREVVRAGGRAAGRFLITKPNPYLMVAGAVLLVAMELMPRADEDGGEATVTLRQQGEGGRPGREVAQLRMDPSGALRAELGGRGAVLGQMDPGGAIKLTPAGEAYLTERAKGAQASGGFPGGTYDAMGNWAGPGDPEPPQPAPQPAAPGPAGAGAASPSSGPALGQSGTAPPGTAEAAQPSPAPFAPPQASAGGNTGRLPPGPPQNVRQDGERDEDENLGPTSSRRRLPDPSTGAWRNANGSPGGPGNSLWFSNNPKVQIVTGKNTGVQYTNGRPDFTPWAKMSINLPYGELTGLNKFDFTKVYEIMSRSDPSKFPTPSDVQRYVQQNNLTPHHALDTCMQLVPRDLNRLVPHIGSASDMRASPPSAGGQGGQP